MLVEQSMQLDPFARSMFAFHTWRSNCARCCRCPKNSSSSVWTLLRMPVSINAISAGKGNLRRRWKTVGCSRSQAT
ncbi:hypothetical protein [Paraburkholderia sp. 40]|uniref:hypothetical protein n=1 Tax=Paraburkholderia sp. 40 TaxID=2991059 RepID=UPI003D2485B5